MNTILRAACCAAIVCGLAASPPASPSVLLLDTRQLLEGQIERTGDGYRVRRDDSETLIPAGRVLAACPDRPAAYRLLADRLGANDADGRRKLAQWCHTNGLKTEAVLEARNAVALEPAHREGLRLLKFYEQSAAAPVTTTAIKPVAASAPVPETIDCSPEALQHYCMRVQPVLMNACVSCHAGTNKMPLRRATSSRPDTFHNLASAMAQINRTNPSASPLLQKALTAHGGAPVPPLRDRGTPAYKQLETWALMLANGGTSTTLPDVIPEPGGKSDFAGEKPDSKKDAPKDPFDPAEFNKPKPK